VDVTFYGHRLRFFLPLIFASRTAPNNALKNVSISICIFLRNFSSCVAFTAAAFAWWYFSHISFGSISVSFGFVRFHQGAVLYSLHQEGAHTIRIVGGGLGLYCAE